jgi:hypothetical protein
MPRSATGAGKAKKQSTDLLNGRRKVAIIGYTRHMLKAPIQHDDWIVFSLNDHYLDLPAIPNERLWWSQVHFMTDKSDDVAHQESVTNVHEGVTYPRDPNHVKWLKEASKVIPLFMLNKDKRFPRATIIDRERVRAFFGKRLGKYCSNSISWMTAIALMQLCPDGKPLSGAEIGIWGVDMMTAGGPGSEYGYQRPSCEAFLGWAIARLGADNVHLPAESDLLASAYEYGDEQQSEFRSMLDERRNELSRRRGEATQQRDNALMAIAELTGGINVLEHIRHAWCPGDDLDATGIRPGYNAHKSLPPPPGGPFPEGV